MRTRRGELMQAFVHTSGVRLLPLFLLLGVPAVHAQTPVRLTLDEAVTRAEAASPRVAEAKARLAAADAALVARQALARPTLTAMSGVLRTNHVDEFGIPQANGAVRVIFPDIPTNYRARAELSLPLFTAGRVDALVASARAERRGVDADVRVVLADVDLEVTTAYWTLVLSRERVRVLDEALVRAEAVVRDVRARVDAGFAPPNEVQSAQAQRARQNVQLIQARNDVAVNEAQLARLVGLSPGDAIATTSPVDRPASAAAATLAESPAGLVQRALDSRPERAGLTEREAALHQAMGAALAARRPQVAALAAVEPARPNQRFVPRADRWNTSWDLGVSVTWSLWDAGRARADAAASSAQADAIRARIADFDAGVAVEVRQRLADVASTRAAIDASGEGIEAATEAARVLRERFDAGVATSTEVIDANVVLLEAQLEQTRLLAALRISEARLLRTTGGSAR